MSAVPKILSAYAEGIDAHLVEVEADLNVGLHSFGIVGLADKAVSEAKERVNSALKNSGIKAPSRENRKITVNLAPAHIKKAGSHFDLPIAISYLAASEQIKKFTVEDKIFVGELSLDGELRPVGGVLNVAILARDRGIRRLVVPEQNAEEAALIREVEIIPVKNLKEAVDYIEGSRDIPPKAGTALQPEYPPAGVTLSEIRGHAAAKRALLIAAAGGHNLFMVGAPGTGKSMLAQTVVSLLPPPDIGESIEVTRVYSAAGLSRDKPILNFRPFRAPHHSASSAAIFGGGQYPRPGEMSLAHRGVLFLDETAEFRRDVLEGLRQPLESGEVYIARAERSLKFPARFMLVAAMNPCPCGYYGDKDKECKCSAHEVFRYQKKISGPFMDRMDIQINIPRVPVTELRGKSGDAREDEEARRRVAEAREVQRNRFAGLGLPYRLNSEMRSKDVDGLLRLTAKAEEMLKGMVKKTVLSARGFYRALRMAQTIADLEEAPEITEAHIAETFQYRVRENLQEL